MGDLRRIMLASVTVAAALTASCGTAPTPTPVPAACGTAASAPAHYDHVVVFAFENRTWDAVGGGGFAGMPYLNALARNCSWFSDWIESDTTQNSGTQYVSQFQGDLNHTVRDDCSPSPTCGSVADNFFRQARTAGLTAINYVEGATSPCSAAGNAVKHVPAMYFQGADDAAHCAEQVRPYTEFDVAHLPDFAFVTPTLCNDGHDCWNDVVDDWARTNIGAVLDSDAYRQGRTLVQVWYDEDRPVPNLYIAPSAHSGPLPAAGYASTLRLWQDALGLGCLSGACTAPDLRPVTGI
jgi:hypothetical protein